jgi:hypothetical protein
MAYVFGLVAIAGGIALIVGGIRKWPWLLNPTEQNMFRHPLTFTSMFVPQRWLGFAAAVYGMAWIAAGIFVMYRLG